jgi:hypothetical protein
VSKFLRTAAIVAGGIALAATGIGAAASAGLLGSMAFAEATLATGVIGALSTVATVASVASGVASLGAALLAKKPSAAASPTAWQGDPDAGIDLVFGDAYNSGKINYRRTYGNDNKYETIVTTWSLGPIAGIDTLYVDQIAKAVSTGGVVDIDDRGKMYEVRQRGLCPEAAALMPPPLTPAGWTGAHRLSGKAAPAVTFIYDKKGGHTFTSLPNCGWRGRGLLGYDPRKDSTYPGGNGPQRANDADTWVFTRNPYIVGLTYCLGYWQNGKRAGGVGLKSGIIVAQFVEGANVADANGWSVGGVKSTLDDKWDVLTDILQAGGGEPIELGAEVGCFVNTPRVRLATVTRDDLADGDLVVPGCTRRKDRINTLSPRYMCEQQVTTRNDDGVNVTATSWAMVTGAPISVADYVTADGRQHRKAVSYPLVQCFAGEQPNQVAQLARYDIENAREIDGIQIPLKLRWMGYRPGDCIGVAIPEAGLADQDVVVRTRGLAPASGTVTMTVRTETAAKHPYALGQTTTAPPAPALNAVMPVNPFADIYVAQTAALVASSYTSGVADNVTTTLASDGTATITIPDHTRIYPAPQAAVAVAGATIAGLAPATTYFVYYDDPDLAGGAVTYATTTTAADAYYSAAHPYRHTICTVTTPKADGTGGSSSGGGPSGSGGWSGSGSRPAIP